jgi:tagatose-1,6-bisphosphate aldolase non-catalytic subunit AgaZ/GatZ
MEEQRIPGLVFYLEDASVKEVGGKKIARVILETHINDWDMYQQVLETINGMTMYPGGDFKDEVIDMLRDETEDLSKKVGQQELSVREAKELVAQTESFHAAEVDVLKRTLALVESKNAQLRAENARLLVMEQELQQIASS